MGESSPGPSTTIKALENEVGGVEERSCWTPVLVGYELCLLVGSRIYSGRGGWGSHLGQHKQQNTLKYPLERQFAHIPQ